MERIPPVIPPLPIEHPHMRSLAVSDVAGWLRAGWKDLWISPGSSLAYGLFVFLASVALVAGLVYVQWDYILFPVTAGFLVYAPALAIGLYEKSREIDEDGKEQVSLGDMLINHARAGGQVFFMGVMLLGLMLLWNRAAIIISGLFFGVRPFPGIDNILPVLFKDPMGIAMLVVGVAVGGLFAAFAFAISAFSFPMMLDQRVDALTAMGTSYAIVFHNLPVMLVWAAAILALFAVSVATGFLGLIIIFPWLGHATWHAYRAVR